MNPRKQRTSGHTAIKRELNTDATPQCVGVIMDGNRRWARRHGRTTPEGHYAGYEVLTDMMHWAKEEGIAHMVVYGFSTENAGRTQKEVDALMELFRTFFKTMTRKAWQNNVAISFIGKREDLPQDIQTGMSRLERETAGCSDLHLVVAAPYGARAELLDAVNRIKDTVGAEESVTEDIVNQHLWTASIPDPDLIIRTGGRKRLSNFLLWQAAYSELVFSDTLWPDLTRREFTKILYDYSLRTRTHGK